MKKKKKKKTLFLHISHTTHMIDTAISALLGHKRRGRRKEEVKNTLFEADNVLLSDSSNDSKESG